LRGKKSIVFGEISWRPEPPARPDRLLLVRFRVVEIDPRPGVSFFARGNAYSMLDEKDCLLARKIKFLYILRLSVIGWHD